MPGKLLFTTQPNPYQRFIDKSPHSHHISRPQTHSHSTLYLDFPMKLYVFKSDSIGRYTKFYVLFPASLISKLMFTLKQFCHKSDFCSSMRSDREIQYEFLQLEWFIIIETPNDRPKLLSVVVVEQPL